MRRAAAALLLALAGCSDDAPRCQGTTVRVVDAAHNEKLEVCAGIASTAEQRQRGLKGHAPLGDDEGLLIVFPLEGEVCVLNSGVDFAIDAVFAADDGRVVEVIGNIAARDDTPYCVLGVRRVLEVRQQRAVDVTSGDHLLLSDSGS